MSQKITKTQYDAVIVGGGFFGCQLALYLKPYCDRILILEKESDLMQRASYNNQARVHNGYHYPRSLLTALRSRQSFKRFKEEYPECIVEGFDKYYAVASKQSKVTVDQFRQFMERIGAPLHKAPQSVKNRFTDLIGEVYVAEEIAFNTRILKDRTAQELKDARVEIRLETEAVQLKQYDGGETLEVFTQEGEPITTKWVFNCTYAQINRLTSSSGLNILPLKHELAEMALIEMPDDLKDFGLTVMCGPFFSLMPFPDKKLHTFSHVRYTPHHEWHDTADHYMNAHKYFATTEKKTQFEPMMRDGVRYFPDLAGAQHKESLWEVKTILPSSEDDDSRPILFHRHRDCPHLVSIMGGKIDNVFDIGPELEILFS